MASEIKHTEVSSKFEQNNFYVHVWSRWNGTGLVAYYNIFGLEMLTEEDPAP